MFFKMQTWRATWQLCLLMSLLNIRSSLSDELSCATAEDCPERQRCEYFGASLSCGCLQDHQALPSGECIKQCNTKTDCYSTEICNKAGTIGKCTCAPGRVWDNEYGDCVKDCSRSTNICKDSAETCEVVGNLHKCKCTSSYTWDDYFHACMKECSTASECDGITEFCATNDKSATYYGNLCLCRRGHTWDTLAEKCKRNSSCGNNANCLEHEVCTNIVNGNGICACDTGYQRNSWKKCIKPCNSDGDCGTTHYVCSEVDGVKSCVCKDNRIWDNKLNACMKQCGYHACDIEGEFCDEYRDEVMTCNCTDKYRWNSVKGDCTDRLCKNNRDCYPTQKCDVNAGICKCPADRQWDNESKSCVKVCEGNSDCDSRTEYCDRVPDPSNGYFFTTKACQCRFGYTWDFQAEECVRNFNCKVKTNCLPHEVCANTVNGYGDVLGTWTCVCDTGYHKNSLGQCIKPCTSDADCGMAHYGCIGDGGAKSCACQDDREWSNGLGRCLKQCNHNDRCDERSEICSSLRNTKVCACTRSFTWNPVRDQCVY